jgi:TPR repeat protein
VTVTPATSTAAPTDQSPKAAEAANVPPAQPAAPPTAAAPEKPPDTAAKNAETTPKSEAPASKAPVQKAAAVVKQPAKSSPRLASPVKAAKPTAIVQPAVPDNSGDAAFRKGDAYLYGRGVPENCDEAIKNLKAASAGGSAKARSTFGTMYATGHCVPRDLPTSYSWFALALRADPNNQILEKDLTAVWNQMTPPERQLTTKQKQ